MCMYIYLPLYMYAYIDTCKHACTDIHIHTYKCVNVYMYIYIMRMHT